MKTGALIPFPETQSTSHLMSYSLKRVKDEVLKCIVVCSNCHREIHMDENGKRRRNI